MAKDELAAKPLVLYEGDDMVALASEEIAIRAVIDHEIETYDPYESEVMVWTTVTAPRPEPRFDPRGLVELDERVPRIVRDRRRPGELRRPRPDHAPDQPRAAPAALRAGRHAR